ncbi:MAG: hypothetical protein K5682_11505, partial [Lachnospiraceae bacterium]|nr:hypothetical protein [Lachnospiraceae bacterium]
MEQEFTADDFCKRNRSYELRIIKICTVLCIVGLALAILSGCAYEPTDRGQIEEYITRELGHKEYELAEASVETETSEYTWKVHDNRNDLDFEVYDDFYADAGIIISVGRTLTDNYDHALLEKYKDLIPEWMTYTGDDKEISYEISYRTVEEMESKCDGLWNLFLQFNGMHGGFTLKYEFRYTAPDRDQSEAGLALAFDYSRADVSGFLGTDAYGRLGAISLEELYTQVRDAYSAFVFLYQLSDPMQELTREDQERAREHSGVYHVGLYDGEGRLSFASDAIGFYDYLSFGNFYNLLQEQGFTVEGTPEDFIYTSDTGDGYHFSYAFWDQSLGAYYEKNGETCAVEREREPVLTQEEILTICGLDTLFTIYYEVERIDRNRDYIIY